MKRPMPRHVIPQAAAVLSRRPELWDLSAGSLVAQGAKEGA